MHKSLQRDKMKKKIYCAGPLFNRKEKEEMLEIAGLLEENDYDVFLPQRDGIEFAGLSQDLRKMDFTEKNINLLLSKAIFVLDVFQVLDSHGLVLNINGRVPDEGAMVEAGIAWNAGKKIVIYKDDHRTLINGNDNPLVLGLSNFITVSHIAEIPDIFRKLLLNITDNGNNIIGNTHLKVLYEKGAKIFYLTKNVQDKNEMCHKLIEILEISSCANHSMKL